MLPDSKTLNPVARISTSTLVQPPVPGAHAVRGDRLDAAGLQVHVVPVEGGQVLVGEAGPLAASEYRGVSFSRTTGSVTWVRRKAAGRPTTPTRDTGTVPCRCAAIGKVSYT